MRQNHLISFTLLPSRWKVKPLDVELPEVDPAEGRARSSQPPARQGSVPSNRRSGQRRRAEVAVVGQVHGWLAWIIAKVAQFPKDLKYVLGHRLVDRSLELLEILVEAAYLPRPDQHAALLRANILVERLRHLVRAAHDNRALATEACVAAFVATLHEPHPGCPRRPGSGPSHRS